MLVDEFRQRNEQLKNQKKTKSYIEWQVKLKEGIQTYSSDPVTIDEMKWVFIAELKDNICLVYIQQFCE
jgi:hypothetical protein